MTKITRLEKITIVIERVSYTGDRVVEGTRSFTQSITYKGITQQDGTHYKPYQEKMMDGISRLILSQIIKQVVLGASWPKP